MVSPALQRAPEKEAVDAHGSTHAPLLWRLQPYHEGFSLSNPSFSTCTALSAARDFFRLDGGQGWPAVGLATR